jgi:acetyltransferase-like isoleucine patch superfamily enzyme
MNQFDVKPSVKIPYFDHKGNLLKTIGNSARRRGYTPLLFIFRKLRNSFLYRIAYFCPINSIRIKCHKWRGVKIGKNVYIGMQCSIDNAYPEYVYIEDNVSIASESLIIAHSNPYQHFSDFTPAQVAPVVIKKGAWLSVRSLILPGVTIGEYVIVAAGSVINSDVPSCSVVSGNPPKIIAKNLPIA